MKRLWKSLAGARSQVGAQFQIRRKALRNHRHSSHELPRRLVTSDRRGEGSAKNLPTETIAS
jgi:hypothetical protein